MTVTSASDVRLSCPRCKREVPDDGRGALCVRCLLGLGLEPPLPRPFGRYELLCQIDAGGMGVVFEARESNPDRLVALKMIRGGVLPSAEEREWFRREAQEASRLEHRNIVTIFHVGEADEPAHYTMRLMTGGTLAEQRERLRAQPRRAARLMATVARAVHYGHTHGILHRDLKPANILLDEEGEPHVADFGIATRVGAGDESPAPIGTPHYMSPEQAGPPPRQLTTKSDVYSLGAILFELLTGRPPFDGATPEAILEQQRTASPPSPRSLAPAIDRDLEAICLRCLEKDPVRRPATDQLAEELALFLSGAPVPSRPLGLLERAWRWARRHPAAAGFAITAALTALILTFTAFRLSHEQEAERRQDILQANAFAARSLAGLALFQLSQSVQVVERLAADPLVLARIDESPGAVPRAVDDARRREEFVTLGIQNTRGFTVARSPLPPALGHRADGSCGDAGADDLDYFERWWGWTDHYKEAMRRGEQGRHDGYLSRPSRSEATGEFKFNISAPVVTPGGGLKGVVYGSFATDSVLGQARLDLGDDPRRTVALLARPDIDRCTQNEPQPTGFVIVVHDRLDRGTTLQVTSAALTAMPLADRDRPLGFSRVDAVPTDDAYRDPVAGFEGRWLAGFAPVGNTGYVVVVQTRHSAVAGPPAEQLKRLAWSPGLPLLLSGASINLLLFLFRRRAG